MISMNNKNKGSDAIESLRSELREIREQVSALRKKGEDTRIADMLLILAPSRIMLADATNEKKDIERVKSLFNKIRNSLPEAP